MLYTILFVACSLATPQDCKYHEIYMTTDTEIPTALYMEAQYTIANWIITHPGVTVLKFKVEKGRES
jgi:hypothetical protein